MCVTRVEDVEHERLEETGIREQGEEFGQRCITSKHETLSTSEQERIAHENSVQKLCQSRGREEDCRKTTDVEKTSVENPLGLHVHGRRKAREDIEVLLVCRRKDDKNCSAIVSESQRENGYVEN